MRALAQSSHAAHAPKFGACLRAYLGKVFQKSVTILKISTGRPPLETVYRPYLRTDLTAVECASKGMRSEQDLYKPYIGEPEILTSKGVGTLSEHQFFCPSKVLITFLGAKQP
jgi:hypothetical protein